MILTAATLAPSSLPVTPLKIANENEGVLAHVGFLTVLHEATGYLGGYLVTNIWGRPLEFRLSSAVQPTRVHAILYAATLEPYICADLIGKTLVDKTATAVQMIVTDRETILDLRLKLEYPVVYLAAAEETRAKTLAESGSIRCHPRFADDVPRTREMLGQLDTAFDLAEPFVRIREAIGEARKMGVHK